MKADLQQMLDGLLAERVELDRAIEAAQFLIGRNGGNGGRSQAKARRVTPQHQPSARGSTPGAAGTPVDWERGRQLWTEGTPVREIAKALGCADGAVYYQASARHWPARKKNGLKAGRRPAARGK